MITSPPMKLHILHLPSWYLPEGGQFCRNQVRELNQHEIHAAVLANVAISTRKYGLIQALKFPKGIFLSHEDEIQVLRNFHISFPFFKKFDSRLWVRKTLKMVDFYCEKFGKPDVIHAHSVLWGGFAAMRIKEKHGIPYVITEHKGTFGMSCQWAENQFLEWQDEFMSKAFSNADLIVPVSENLIPKISSFLKKDVAFRVVSNMVDTDFFHYKERESSSDEVRAVMVNGFNYAKAYDILFPAADEALKRNKNLTITIVGEDFFGKNFEELLNRVERKDRIKFLGEMDQEGVRKALFDADFFIISSRVESQSVSVLEALSTGLPIVCTEVVPKQIADSANSIRVPVENVEALTEGILEMSHRFNDFDRKMISENVKKIADRREVAGELVEIYQSLI